MLEPYEGKRSCTVLRGEGGSNTPDLPDLLINIKPDHYGFIAQLVERPAVNRMVAGSNPAVPSLELRPMAGHLSYTQFTRVRIPQLRSCFSGVTGSAADL